MEWLVVILVLIVVEIGAVFGGSDSRPGIDDAPHRAL